MGKKIYYALLKPDRVDVQPEHLFVSNGGRFSNWGKQWRFMEAESLDEAFSKAKKLAQQELTQQEGAE